MERRTVTAQIVNQDSNAEVCMIETPEGMGSRKFSFQVEGGLTAETQSLVLCQGAQKLAHLTPDGKAV